MNVNRTFLTLAALGVTGASASSAQQADNQAPSKEGHLVYTVKDGDTLASVAQAAQVQQSELMALNSLTTSTLEVGQTLDVGKSAFAKPQVVSPETPLASAAEVVALALSATAANERLAAEHAVAMVAAERAMARATEAAAPSSASAGATDPEANVDSTDDRRLTALAQTSVPAPVINPTAARNKTSATPLTVTPLAAAPVSAPVAPQAETQVSAAPVQVKTASAQAVASTPIVSRFNTAPQAAVKPAPAVAQRKPSASPAVAVRPQIHTSQSKAPAVRPQPQAQLRTSSPTALTAQALMGAFVRPTAAQAAPVTAVPVTAAPITKATPARTAGASLAQSAAHKAKVAQQASANTALIAQPIAQPVHVPVQEATVEVAPQARTPLASKPAPRPAAVAALKPKLQRRVAALPPRPTPKAATAQVRPRNGTGRINAAAYRYVGIRYVLGGMGSRGIDCSAFTLRTMRQLGVNLPRTSRQQWLVGRAVRSNQLQPGDLVFFNTNGRGVSHVGIYIGNDRFINANSYRGKVVEENMMGNPYWRARYVGARRVL